MTLDDSTEMKLFQFDIVIISILHSSLYLLVGNKLVVIRCSKIKENYFWHRGVDLHKGYNVFFFNDFVFIWLRNFNQLDATWKSTGATR